MGVFDHAAELEACARRDVSALRRLYEREAGFLLAVALRIVRRREVAADVIHDSFLDIWERAGSFDREKGAARAWIASIVRYRALKHARRAGREVEPAASELEADEAPDPLARLEASQDAARLRVCLARLEPERRQAIVLAYTDGLSHAEIASRLGAPLGTVKAWIRRSLLALKECLS
ncbi:MULTISPECIES: sigma-70 family RNA polymerase sigma factor [Methylobacterium]|uniref:ECF RNA polymerase sigma factor SigK n=2 Tax=Pseudomonadota TaxID=1224 RepID=A0ABQ4T078_9HYPH|nr:MULTISPECIES: sigma-70 family RNA polymerase sigma factor [Methylobacterium]PIU06270.1 MAG: RNA polymerase subunit sigma [Methylobacterium sp. CG09_land_8_20_14_0_10_71_15]PIU11179.1 MAG: RNA polymerase subunit sigma [Methylobacterium sp. CG08_land_8_20_14_0_20_71_15]GBU19566.1 RNA polymerase sigma factor [Methylobacterium sp.]GJE07538.1 ECF RNA polymerase sigma factor SigK [Methylobacterium jeotgali]